MTLTDTPAQLTSHGHHGDSVAGYGYHCPDETMVRLVVRDYAPVRLGSSEGDISLLTIL